MERSNWQDGELLSIKDIEAQYPREWLAIQVTGFDEHYSPISGRVIVHSLNREEISDGLKDITREELGTSPIFITRSSVGMTPMDRALEFRAMMKLMGEMR